MSNIESDGWDEVFDKYERVFQDVFKFPKALVDKKLEVVLNRLEAGDVGVIEEIRGYNEYLCDEESEVSQQKPSDDRKEDTTKYTGLSPVEKSIYQRRRENWASMRAERKEGSKAKARKRGGGK